MAGFAANMGPLAVDQHSSNKQFGAEPWLEPWLIKHSSFYRKHLVSKGRRESKSERRGSAASAFLESRRQSVVTNDTGDAGDDHSRRESNVEGGKE